MSGNRKSLMQEQNRIREAYNQQRVAMEKAGASVDQMSKLKSMFNNKMQELESSMGDDLMSLNKGNVLPISGGTVSGVEVDQSKLPDASKMMGQGKQGMFKRIGRKVAGVVPVVGALASAAMSEDASAAVPFLGDAEGVGMSAQDENAMLNEYDARRDYDNSQASKDARKAALMKITK